MSDAVSALVALARLLTPQERASVIDGIRRLDEPDAVAVAEVEPDEPDDEITPQEAAHIADCCYHTIIGWCHRFEIGRNPTGRWKVSRRKLRALLERS